MTTRLTGIETRYSVDLEPECIPRVKYLRPAGSVGECPFCLSDENVEFVDEVGVGGTYRKQRFECECGAYGDGDWFWEAGTIESAGGGSA